MQHVRQYNQWQNEPVVCLWTQTSKTLIKDDKSSLIFLMQALQEMFFKNHEKYWQFVYILINTCLKDQLYISPD